MNTVVRRRKKTDEPVKTERRAKIVKRAEQPRPAPKRSARNERTNKPSMPRLDKSGRYAAACLLLAAELGYRAGEVWQYWTELVLMHEYEQSLPRVAAEERAFRDVKAMLDKRDSQSEAS